MRTVTRNRQTRSFMMGLLLKLFFVLNFLPTHYNSTQWVMQAITRLRIKEVAASTSLITTIMRSIHCVCFLLAAAASLAYINLA